MSNQFRSALGFVCCLAMIGVQAVVAADRETAIKRCKEATAFVDLGMFGSGTAFCVHPRGVFVTNYHVVSDVGLGGTVTIILNSGEPKERSVETRVINLSEENDLAVLLAKEPENSKTKETFVALNLVRSSAVKEVDSILAFGYPFGAFLAASTDSKPSVTITTGKVTALRRVDKELRAIQIDAAVNPGNSGGPLVNQAGGVIGVICAGSQLARIGFAIPADFVAELLSRPALVVEKPDIPFALRTEEHRFKVDVLEMAKGASADEVGLEIADATVPSRRLRSKVVKGKAEFVVSPFTADQPQPRIKLIVRNDVNNRTLELDDMPINVGAATLRLSEIRKIERRPTYSIVACNSGRKLAGMVKGLEKFQWNDGSSVDFGELDLVDVYGLGKAILPIEFEYTAIRNGQVVSTLRQQVAMKGAPAPLDRPRDAKPDPFAPFVDEIIIETRIGGVDELHVTPDGLYWRHKQQEKPGEVDQGKPYALVNGKRWNFQWRFTAQTDQGEDVSALYPMKLGYGTWRIDMMWVRQDRNSANDFGRCQHGIRDDDDGETIVDFNDVASGTSVYRFRLTRSDKLSSDRATALTVDRNQPKPSIDLQPQTTVDIAKLITAEHAYNGRFERVNGELVSIADSDPQLILPVVVRGSYEIEFDFTRLEGAEPVMMHLPAGSSSFMVTFGGFNGEHGIELIDGKEMREYGPETGIVTRPGVVQSGRRYSSKIRVDLEPNDRLHIQAELDGKPVANWKGNVSQLAPNVWHIRPLANGLVWRTWRSRYQIHKLAINLGANCRASQLGDDWANNVSPVSDQPPAVILAKCSDWNGRKYFVSDELMDRNTAQQLAAEYQGRLITVSTTEEQQFLNRQYPNRQLWSAIWQKGNRSIWRDERNRIIRVPLPWATGQPGVWEEQLTSLTTFDTSQGYQPGLHDYRYAAERFHACIEWGEEFPQAR